MTTKNKTVFMILACCVLLACNNPAREDSLRWKTAVDIPVNRVLEFTGVPSGTPLASTDSVLLDMGAETVHFDAGFFDILHRLEEPEAGYRVTLINGTDANFILYGLVFREGDAPASWSAERLYDELTGNYTLGRGRINLMGPDGLGVLAGDTVGKSMDSRLNGDLCHLFLNHTSLSWRWVARVSGSDYAGLGNAGFLDLRSRIEISGVNSFNSLFNF
ncbi:MAG: hypothetical protein LBC70_07010 [Chitinispirillales bacterium]|jgi:hypothetical protein|nr:hypothetical protein [Chitinispirillales bacterium]